MSQSMQLPPEHAGFGPGFPRRFVIAKTAGHGAQTASLAATPLYLLWALRKRSFNFRSLFMANWTVPLFGGLLFGSYATFDTYRLPPQEVFDQYQTLRLNSDIAAEDGSIIGAVCGALIAPAIFLKRIGLINGILGGIGMGSGAGLIAQWVRAAQADALAKPSLAPPASSPLDPNPPARQKA